jgi:hypothetical protein
VIQPTKGTETIAISCVEFSQHLKHMLNQKQKDFYIFGKLVVGNDVHLQIRAMRVNEFVSILTTYKIKWRHIP